MPVHWIQTKIEGETVSENAPEEPKVVTGAVSNMGIEDLLFVEMNGVHVYGKPGSVTEPQGDDLIQKLGTSVPIEHHTGTLNLSGEGNA